MILVMQAPPPPPRAQWVWSARFEPLACKARLFDRLELALGDAKRRWPETWVLRSTEAVASWHSAVRNYNTSPSAPQYFVKHPRSSGGNGTFPAANSDMACARAIMVLNLAQDAVVIQRAVVPASLPRGACRFELRVWALLRQKECLLFEHHRAKTAITGLMNRQVQTNMDAFGRFYADNIASETDVCAAFRGNVYNMRTKPDIANTVALIHRLIQREIPENSLVFAGFDFIVDECARAWFIEANVKPAFRYADTTTQFPSPIVRELAHYATADLARVLDDEPALLRNGGSSWVKLCRRPTTNNREEIEGHLTL